MSSSQDRAAYSTGALIPFVLLHVACVMVLFEPLTLRLLLLAISTYAVRIFAIGAGYHRYFSHRTYTLNRFTQFVVAVLAQTSAQKGVLWWAAKHRQHHRDPDGIHDVHSPLRSGFWWSHVGWIVSDKHETYDPRHVSDLIKFPELVWLDRHHWIPSAVLGAIFYLLGGWPAFFWGFVVSTVVVYHCTFSINSLAHLWGSRRFQTRDGSRNNWFLALITFGEGWHNNHHWDMNVCRQGLRWWELDITYLLLKAVGFLGVARNIKEPRAVPAKTA